MDLVTVFALFVFMLSLQCFCVLPFSSVNKDLYYRRRILLGAATLRGYMISLLALAADRIAVSCVKGSFT